MHIGHRPREVGLAVAAGLAAIALAACGGGASASSSSSAGQLLKDTFTGSHKLSSGVLDVELAVTPSGSSTFTTPITLSFGGPFEDAGAGKIANSNFTLRVSALGTSLLSAGLESLDGKGYVTLGTASYRLPAREYGRLESRLSSSGAGAGPGSGILGKLGIDPLRWLAQPAVVGSGTVGGVSTTHIRARLNVGALIDDIGTVLGKAGSIGVGGAGKLSISPATKSRIVAEVKNPNVDIWTGASDRTLRKLALSLALPVSGKLSTELGGIKSTAISLDVLYRNLGQPQTISPPAAVKPYSAFRARVRALVRQIQGVVSPRGP